MLPRGFIKLAKKMWELVFLTGKQYFCMVEWFPFSCFTALREEFSLAEIMVWADCLQRGIIKKQSRGGKFR